jgi:hypothetical protein
MEIQSDFRDLLELFNKHKVGGNYGETPVCFIGREQLVVNKRTVGRKRDLADLEALGEA